MTTTSNNFMKDITQKYNIFDLAESHKSLLSKYLAFFKSKQDKFIREVKSTVDDFKESSLKDMMYSQEDLQDLIETLKENISKTMNSEITYYVNMNAIFIQLLMHEADSNNTTLKVEMSQIQNLTNINEMDEFIKSITGQNKPSEFLGKKNSISKLSSISKTQNLISDFEQVKYDFEMLQQNFNILKNQNELLVKENSNLQQTGNLYSKEIDELRNRLKNSSLNESKSENINKIQEDLELTKKNLDEQVSKYQKLLNEYDVKLSQSIQFQQLKKLLQDKNSLIIELKSKIANFEEEK